MVTGVGGDQHGSAILPDNLLRQAGALDPEGHGCPPQAAASK